MTFDIPLPLRQEHEALHGRLRQATGAGGEVGEAARALAQLMHPHFVKEDRIAMPPLGLLAELAQGGVRPEMAAVLALTDELQSDLPAMLKEHEAILQALGRLQEAARRAGLADVEAFTHELMRHARTEEAVMYPAALLVGQVVRQRLAEGAARG